MVIENGERASYRFRVLADGGYRSTHTGRISAAKYGVVSRVLDTTEKHVVESPATLIELLKSLGVAPEKAIEVVNELKTV